MALNDIKRAALKALGFGDDEIVTLETKAAQTEKSADAQGVAYKAAGDEEPAPDDAAAEDAGDYIGDMGVEEFTAFLTPLITSAVVAAMGGQAAKTEEVAHAQATKSAAIEGQVSALTAQIATQTAALTAAQTALKELQGDQPRALYRASQDAGTVLGEGHALKAYQPAPDPLLAAADRLMLLS